MIKINLKDEQRILDFHYSNIISCKNSLLQILDSKSLEASKNSKKNGNAKIQQMFDFLKKSIVKCDKEGFSILTAKPNELDRFKIDFEDKFKDVLNQTYKKYKRKKITYRQELLKTVFFYNSYDKWKAYELAKRINTSVCPYCNRSYTFVLGSEQEKGTRFEYDHFFDKVTYPYLALSFYNLIPSCHICNSTLKGSAKFSLDNNIHPYVEGFSKDIIFSIVPEKSSFILGISKDYDIDFKGNENSAKYKRAQENIKVFRLKELYNMHKDYVDNLIKISVMYDNDFINILYSKYDGTLFSNKSELKNIIYQNVFQEEDYSNRILSKLTTDIINDIELYEKK